MEDSELLYYYLVAKNEIIFPYLYERYRILGKQIMIKIYRKFYFVPLELSDLESIIFLTFAQSIYQYQSWHKMSFKSFYAINLEWAIINYLKKYSTKNHQVINYAVSFQENYFMTTSIQNFYDCQINWDNLRLTAKEKNVVELKQQGYSNFEIMTKLMLTYKQIDNAFQRVKLKLTKFYY